MCECVRMHCLRNAGTHVFVFASKDVRKEMFHLMTHSTHFIYSYMW